MNIKDIFLLTMLIKMNMPYFTSKLSGELVFEPVREKTNNLGSDQAGNFGFRK